MIDYENSTKEERLAQEAREVKAMFEIYKEMRQYIAEHQLVLVPNRVDVEREDGSEDPRPLNTEDEAFLMPGSTLKQHGWYDTDYRLAFRMYFEENPKRRYGPWRHGVIEYYYHTIRDNFETLDSTMVPFLEVWISIYEVNDVVIEDIMYIYRLMFDSIEEDILIDKPHAKLKKISVPRRGDLARFYTIVLITLELRRIKFWRHPIYWSKLWLLRLRRKYLVF